MSNVCSSIRAIQKINSVDICESRRVLKDLKQAVREWYGNLPISVLISNKMLQKKIMDFEDLCRRKEIMLSEKLENLTRRNDLRAAE